MDIIDSYFRCILKEQFTLTDVKVTSNFKGSLMKPESVSGCDAQIPHRDADSNQVVFLVIPITDSVVITRVYGSYDELKGMINIEEFKAKLQFRDLSVSIGQCIIFLPHFLHAGPKISIIPRGLVFFEFTSVINAAYAYDQTFINELFKDDEEKSKAIDEMIKANTWN